MRVLAGAVSSRLVKRGGTIFWNRWLTSAGGPVRPALESAPQVQGLTGRASGGDVSSARPAKPTGGKTP